MPSLKYKPVSTVEWKGLTIKIENPAGSIRRGISKSGVSWETKMPYDYGFVDNSKGVDGDEVDVFLGPDKSASFVYVMHTTKKESGEFDEDKCFLGFSSAMDAMQAFKKSFDIPGHYTGQLETIPWNDFKTKVLATRTSPTMIHASRLNTTIALYAQEQNPFTKGDEVVVDGLRGRGIVTTVDGRRCVVRFPSTEYVSRDYMFLHNVADREAKMWRD